MTCNATSPGSPSIEPLYLALNAAEDRLQLVLGRGDGELLHAQEYSAFGRAMPLLAPALEHAFARLGLDRPALKRSLAGIACVRGPGNFTGLRLSLATALGLGKALDIPLAGLDYLPLLATGPLELMPEQTVHSVWVVTHARQGEVYAQGFTRMTADGGNLPSPLCPAATMPPEKALDLAASAPGPAGLLGSGIRLHQGLYAARAPELGLQLLPAGWDHARPGSLLRHCLGASYAHTPVAPLYLRTSDAEENLPHLARKQGRDPERMRAELSRLRDTGV